MRFGDQQVVDILVEEVLELKHLQHSSQEVEEGKDLTFRRDLDVVEKFVKLQRAERVLHRQL